MPTRPGLPSLSAPAGDMTIFPRGRQIPLLCYPVITMGEFTHPGTKEHITKGADPDTFSVEKQISGLFPPTFLWHTADDGSVPVENTLLLLSELRKNRIPFECHIFTHGEHGLSTCTAETETENPACAQWMQLAKNWLNERFAFTPRE